MKKKEIKVGGTYTAKVSGKLTTVRVMAIREGRGMKCNQTHYDVVNLTTGRKTTFVSAMKFRRPTRVVEVSIKDVELINTKHEARVQDEVKPSLADRLREMEMKDVDLAPHVIVEARAGTGKTTTLVEGIKRVMGIDSPLTPSPQQAAVWEAMEQSKGKAQSICFCCFNRSIRDELEKRVPEGCDAMTMHSMGLKAVGRAFPDLRIKVDGRYTEEIVAGLLGRDIWDLRRKDREMLNAVCQLVDLCKMNLIGPTPVKQGYELVVAVMPYGYWQDKLSDLASYYDVDLNGRSAQVFDLVPRVLEESKDVARHGTITYGDMIWLPIALDLNVYKYDLLLIDEFQDCNRCQHALAKKAGRRLICCGDPKQCLTADTVITLEGGESTTIDKIRVGDHIMTFNPNQGRFAGRRHQGKEVESIHSEDYSGEVIQIGIGGKKTICTPGHRWWVRFAEHVGSKFCLYLMERSGQFRIGICQMQYSCGMGVSSRARSENADRVWVLDVFNTYLDARLAEEVTSTEYGLPQLVFEQPGKGPPDQEFLNAVYSEIGCNSDRAERCLAAFGRLSTYPIWEKDGRKHNYLSVTKGFVLHAANLIQGCFQFRYDDGSTTGEWRTASIRRYDYGGKVYGITVAPTERDLRLYIANKIVSHNSIYGFAGADSESMARMERELAATDRGCVHLPLTVTRRCGKAIVAEVKNLVPDFEAHETNPEGKISHYHLRTKDDVTRPHTDQLDYRSAVADGDMILCRCNAPLVSECFSFIRQGRRANIQGRDVGAGLIRTVEKLMKGYVPQITQGGTGDGEDLCLGAVQVPTDEIVELHRRLGDWTRNETAKERAKRNPSEQRIINLQDKEDCIACFTEGAKTVAEVISKINAVFTDDKDLAGIRLSSVHRAKGLESNRVFFLVPKEAPCPHPMAKTPWEKSQELNIKYVGITRAISELIWVS